MGRIFGFLGSLAGLFAAGREGGARLTDFFSVEEIARADRYKGPHYLAAFSSLGVALLATGAMGLGPGSRRLGNWSARIAGERWVRQALLLAAVVVVVPVLLALPFSVLSHSHDRSWGLRTDSLAGALIDIAKATGFQVVVACAAGLGFVALARALPRVWPAYAALAGVGLTFLLVWVFPVVYEPAFNRFDPAPREVRARVLAIAKAEGVGVRDVLVADASRRTTKQNAYVSGIGSTRRVVLYDTLLQKSSPREVDVVVAHEIAHEKHRDVLKGALYGAAGVVAGIVVIRLILGWGRFTSWIGVSGPGDPRVLPFLAFFIVAAGLVAAPLQNWISRGAEAAADLTAITVTKDPTAAISLEVNLSRDALADLRPNRVLRWAFYTHPAPLERIQSALDYESAHRP
ncbi:MAG: M48 family metalloprotease [Actinomycetota bacterium]